MLTKPSVSVYLPVYNEEKNIINIMNDIYEQICVSFSLKDVVVIGDGCTDRSLAIVNNYSIKFPNLRIIRHKKKRGKIARLNEIFKINSSKYLIILDADIRIHGRQFFNKILAPFQRDHTFSMVAANEIPVRPKSFIGKIIYRSFTNWDHICARVPESDTVHSFGGAATAYCHSFTNNLHIPLSAKEERLYIYLGAKKSGRYYFAQDALVYYRPVSTLSEWISLSHRSFGDTNSVVESKYHIKTSEVLHIPLKYKLFGIYNGLIEDPFYASLGLILNWLLAHFKNSKRVPNNGIWEYASSTKQPITKDDL